MLQNHAMKQVLLLPQYFYEAANTQKLSDLPTIIKLRGTHT